MRIFDVTPDKFNVYQMWLDVVNKRRNHPCTGMDRPLGFQKAGAHRFQDNWHMEDGKALSPNIGRLYPPFLVLISIRD